ncbi:SDR family oxidoreductase [Micromonospora sp. WMMD961]|uniref:SDR family oxidoreductase n=1 Tax=Micromonospora sp. WMMD961 TaxID=3016100 RepID=UPI002417E6C2|nr:SDR family oxidoreductase [Micromonospora sp. WMMD961]MDG4780544.1 SDR family oxidoreductase [Micromonospora sp. WMMD961]
MTRHNTIITGASSGLGRGLAYEFAARGRNLALFARRTDRLKDIRDDLSRRFPNVTVLIRALDVTDAEAVEREFVQVADELGALDRVIVNAGVGFGSRIGDGNFAANAAVLRTNVLGALAQCESAMRAMRRQGHGHLVLMSSAAAFRGAPGNMAAYAASKSAVASLGEAMRIDVLDQPITVTTLHPGYIRTEMNEGVENLPFIIDEERGTRLLAAAIEREPAKAFVPNIPWRPLTSILRHLPDRAVARLS